MACKLFAAGVVTGNCSTWISIEIELGDISAESPIPSQSVRKSPSSGCPSGYPLHRQGVQMNALAGYPNNTYYLVTWQSPPTLIKRGDTCALPAVKYDCINGACLPKATYNTPGLYQSLEDCEVACGAGCSGKCISNSEWAQIEGLSDEVRSTNCS